MRVREIGKLAKSRGINPAKIKKADLIRLIQREEGNFDCFASASEGICDQEQCMWRGDCFVTATSNQH